MNKKLQSIMKKVFENSDGYEICFNLPGRIVANTQLNIN